VRHRPEYVNASAPYVRPALYAPPRPDQRPISRWAASWRSLVYLAGVLVALGVLISMFAYGVIEIRGQLDGTPARSAVWVTPSTYGAPGPNRGPTR
jgi:hypothetical protein